MSDTERIAALEDRVTKLDAKLGLIIDGLSELRQINRELARLNDLDLDVAPEQNRLQ